MLGVTDYRTPTGFVAGALVELPLGGGAATVLARSNQDAYDPLAVTAGTKTLLYALDPLASASIAADGLVVRARTGRLDRRLGVAVLGAGTWSLSPGGATVAIGLGRGRALWQGGHRVARCVLPAARCVVSRLPATTVAFDPALGGGGRLAFVTAAALAARTGPGAAAPSASVLSRWPTTLRVAVGTKEGRPHVLGRLGTAGDPEWVGGGPGLLVVRRRRLWYLARPTAPPVAVSPAFLPAFSAAFGDAGAAPGRRYALAPA